MMGKNHRKILETYDIILSKKDLLNELTVSSPLETIKVNSGFGPRWDRFHHGLDLKAASGTDILSPDNGVVTHASFDNNNCGGTLQIKHDGFSTRYCHVKDFKVRINDVVKKGQVVGLTGGDSNDRGRGNSGGPHLHFELYINGKTVDPEPYLTSAGAKILPSGSGETIEPLSINNTSATSTGRDKLYHSDKLIGSVGSTFEKGVSSGIKTESIVKEQKIFTNFGKNIETKFGNVILRASNNSKINSPVSGEVKLRKYNPSCKNAISIEFEMNGFPYFLEYCGVSEPKVKKGKKVNQGDLLGKTNEDVYITLYNKSGERQSIDLFLDKAKQYKPKEKSKENVYYQDPLVAFAGKILDEPLNIFRNKYDKEGNLISKRFGSPTDPTPVDTWFQKMSPTYKKK